MDKKYLLWGAGGLVLVVGGFFFLRNLNGGSASPDTSNTGDLTQYSPFGYAVGGGGTTSSDDSSSTDQLTQLLAAQTTQNQQNYQLGEDTLNSNERIQMATLDTQKAIALDTNQANIEQSLAGQLSGIVSAMQTTWRGAKGAATSSGVGEVAGAIGFKDGKIVLDIAGSQVNFNGKVSNQAAVDNVKNSPLITNQSVASAIAGVGASH